MTAKKAKPNVEPELIEQIEPIEQLEKHVSQLKLGVVRFYFLGQTPLIMNRMAEKARLQILLPKPEKANRAERAATPKHDPLFEYRSSCYRNRSEKEPAFFHLPSGGFKKCLAQAAVDVPGSTKAAVGRLTSVMTGQVNLFGIPQLGMAVVRSSGQNRVPDVRTRAFFPSWACSVQYRYVKNLITERLIFNLLSYAGVIVGIGDGRPEKGALNFGQFAIVEEDDPEYQHIVKTMGREAQLEAYNNPECFDEDTSDMLAWYNEEIQRREQDERTAQPQQKRRPQPLLTSVGNGGATA